ncbi:MAG: hypothetical protein WBF89_21520 [Steroidobacteraceae bacterium]
MSEFRPSNGVPKCDAEARCHNLRDGVLVGLVLLSLVRASEALAGDQASLLNAAVDNRSDNVRQAVPRAPDLTASLQSFGVPNSADRPTFSATDFRPRKPTVFDRDPASSSFGETSMLRNTTVWQRLSEYRSHDRVQVLTLWESRASTISLQAGRRGDPSLQWTSRLMNRGGATQGLLDRLFSTSLARAGSSLRNVARPSSVPADLKPPGVPEAAGLK